MKLKYIITAILLCCFTINNFAQNRVDITVFGACGMCQDRIETIANGVTGVLNARWDGPSRLLSVDTDTSLFVEKKLHKTLALSGHDTNKYTAPDDVYNELPNCCQYREVEYHEMESNDETELRGSSSELVKGKIYTLEKKKKVPLIAANLRWLNEEELYVSDLDGKFELPYNPKTDQLVVSYVGFASDTLSVKPHQLNEIAINPDAIFETITITYKKFNTEISKIDAIGIYKISEDELRKAACCNLSESFETNPTVDVSFTDAVTGTKQIAMLGLSGRYVQLSREIMPGIRGLSTVYGLNTLPGPWVESIQLNKGVGSVSNGFESITGQINIELRKPQCGDMTLLNIYANNLGRYEANAHQSIRFNENLSTSLLFHVNTKQGTIDRNDDGFLDLPQGENISLINRWKWFGNDGWTGQFAVHGMIDTKNSGQVDFDGDLPNSGLWGSEVDNKHLEVWNKVANILPNNPASTIGLQTSIAYHDTDAFYGNKLYKGEQLNLYANLLFESLIARDIRHAYKMGLSFQADHYNEQSLGYSFERNENIPGAFFEYNYKFDKWSVLFGMRGDYHNNYGFFFTPRVHARYSMTESSTIRISAGRGQRTPNVFAENPKLYASSRVVSFRNNLDNNLPYGLEAEIAWNYGITLHQEFELFGKKASFLADYFYTDFDNKVIFDYEFSPQQILIYNQQGRTYSNSFQAQIDVEVLNDFDVRFAYRYVDVQERFGELGLEKPFTPKHRLFLNLGYEIGRFSLDWTGSWRGEQRIPNTSSNPVEFRLNQVSDPFFLMNAQISYDFKAKHELYMGGENLLDFRQENPIIDANDPFSEYFDGSLAWGPIAGRVIYLGYRYRL